MRILIIGGTGLISTYITRQLLEQGHEVTHYNRGQSAAQMSEGIRRIQGDRTDYPRFAAQMAELESFDCAIDMVCYEPEDAQSALNALRGKVAQYILCSTVDVYTKPAARYPITESETRTAIRNFSYAEKKVVCEAIAFEAHERGDFAVTVIRPAYTYGEGRGPIHSFDWGNAYLDRLRKGKPIIVHGDGMSLWTACHAEDEARAFVGAIGNTRAYGKGYHATGEEWLTWNELYRQVAQVMGAPEPTFVHIPTDLLNKIAPAHAHICSVNFQFNNIFDNSAARNELGFRYTISWRQGVQRVLAWLDEHNGIPDSDDDPLDDQVIAAWEASHDYIKQQLADIKGL